MVLEEAQGAKAWSASRSPLEEFPCHPTNPCDSTSRFLLDTDDLYAGLRCTMNLAKI